MARRGNAELVKMLLAAGTDLEAKSVPYLLYRTPHWTQNETNPQRFPIVFEYIHAHYEPLKTFGGIEIWHRVD